MFVTVLETGSFFGGGVTAGHQQQPGLQAGIEAGTTAWGSAV
jgi:hypothetical protein